MRTCSCILWFVVVFLPVSAFAQTGPFSAASASNNASTGSNAWSTPANIGASDNNYATVSASGNTNYLFATNFGFSIPTPANIDGIQLDIEKSEVSPVAVSILDGWSNGLTKTISAGTNRCLIVVFAAENGNDLRDITSMTYGGQAMTPVLEITAGSTGSFNNRLEVWMLKESGIAAATSTALSPTYVSGTLLENVEFFTSAVFQNVDQATPVYSSQTTASNSSTNPHQLSSAFSTLLDGMAITGVICGNNTSPSSSIGGTNTYTVNSSFTEGTDIYTANASYSTSGISVETATKACASTGTEQPAFTFNGTVNRAAMFGFTLQRARALDNGVYLLRDGAIEGNSLALSTTSWPTADGYVTYGGPTELWGTSWTLNDINRTDFGAALSASRSNGNLRVDHFRMTVYWTNTLPIDLVEFTAAPSGNEVQTHWVTASEQDNDYFEVERTTDGATYETVGTVDGAGNSTQLHTYSFNDPDPLPGISYYRLKQVDFNGRFSYSPIVAVTFTEQTIATVYPNPSVGGVFTFVEQNAYTENEVAVFSADLQLVKKVIVAPGEKAIISLADQPDGTYFLVYSENGERKVSQVQKLSREN